MEKKNELWIAIGSDTLTGVVTHYKHINIIQIAGIISEDDGYFTNVILAAIHQDCLFVELDVCEMAFFNDTVNEYAIDCLMKLIAYIVNNRKQLTITISDKYVNDILLNVIGVKFKKFVKITYDQTRVAAVL